MDRAMAFPKLGFEVTKPKTTLVALTLVMTVLLSGYACNAQTWLKILADDLPVLIQMASTIAQLVVQFGGSSDPEVQQKIQEIGSEAVKDSQLVQKLYEDYEKNPSDSSRQQLEAALGTIATNLPDLLTAAHIKDPALLQKVSAAVNLIVSTVNTILALMPSVTTKAGQEAKAKVGHPTARNGAELRKAWQEQVGVPLVEAK